MVAGKGQPVVARVGIGTLGQTCDLILTKHTVCKLGSKLGLLLGEVFSMDHFYKLGTEL